MCSVILKSPFRVTHDRLQLQPSLLIGKDLPAVYWFPACVTMYIYVQRDERLPTLLAQQMLGVVASVLAVVCKRMHQLPTRLGPAVYRGKDTSHTTLEIMCNGRVWPQQCWTSSANGSNIVGPLFGDHGTKEILGVVGSKG